MRALKRGIEILITGIVFLMMLLTLPKIAGIRTYAVTSGSMEPQIHTGSLVYVSHQSFEDIREGDILTFTINEGSLVVTHRVKEKSLSDRSFLTKGDANAQPDRKRVRYEEVIGTVQFVVPGAGYAASILGNIWGKIIAAAFLVWLFAMEAIIADFQRLKKREELIMIEEEGHKGCGDSSSVRDVCRIGRGYRGIPDTFGRAIR